MTVELRTWQVDGTEGAHGIYMVSSQTGEGECKECGAKLRWVVPDSRLQAIADAWENFRSMNSPLLKEMTGEVVAALLDALTKEDR